MEREFELRTYELETGAGHVLVSMFNGTTYTNIPCAEKREGSTRVDVPYREIDTRTLEDLTPKGLAVLIELFNLDIRLL